LSDGDDELTWIAKQSWSNGKVGLIGCSSTAEWQLAVAAQGNPALAAIIPQGFGAGVGRVAPYFEQGNWYRGGAVQMLFIAWLYGEQNQVRPMFPAEHFAGRFDPRVEVVRPRAATTTRRLVPGAASSSRNGYLQSRRWPAWNLCR
jgi:predicted acyl esterase